jgi:ATP-dependent helicase HrpA
VVDEQGRERARGKDLAALKAPLAGEFRQAIAEVASDAGLARTGLTSWEIGDLPATVTEKRAGHEVTVYPALDDEGTAAAVVVCGSLEEAEARHRLGVTRLLLLAAPDPTKRVIDALSMHDKLALASTPYPSTQALVEDCRAAVVQQVVDARPRAMTRAAFEQLRAALGSAEEHQAAVAAVLADALRALAAWREADKVLSGRADMYQLPALTDMKQQLARLMAGTSRGGFIREAGAAQLRRYPTYLAAIVERRRKLDANGSNKGASADRQLQDRIAELQEHYLHQVAALAPGRPPGERLRQARWMLEEYRVQLWAQHLGTAQTVSDQRIRKVLG